MAQDGAAVAQVALEVEQLAHVAIADGAHPERHDLHQPACIGRADRIFPESAFHLDQPEHQRRLQPGPLGLVVDRLDQFHADLRLGNPGFEPARHLAQPFQVAEPLAARGERRPDGPAIGNGRRQRAAHGVGQRLLLLRPRMGRGRRNGQQQAAGQRGPAAGGEQA